MKQRRRVWFSIHSWLGLTLCILLSFVFLTGALSVLSPEMDWALNPEMRVGAKDELQRASWGELYDTARKVSPESRTMELLRHEDPRIAAQATIVTPWGEKIRLWINPYTSQYQGRSSWFNVQQYLLRIHSYLMFPEPVGSWLVRPLSLVVLASLTTGLLVYGKFWRGFFRMPRFSQPARAWLGDVHRLTAIWSIWFIAIIGGTGAYYFASHIGLGAWGWSRGSPPVERTEIMPDGLTGAEIDAVVAKAINEIPGLQVRIVSLPDRRWKPISVLGHASATLVTPHANGVYFDPTTLEILGSIRGEELGAYQRVSEAVSRLHFGTWGGLASRIVWVVFGLILTGISVTGAAIYGQRATARPQHDDAQEPVAQRHKIAPGAYAKIWHGIGFLKWPSLGAILAALALSPFLGPDPPDMDRPRDQDSGWHLGSA